jgi:hypothetical protein
VSVYVCSLIRGVADPQTVPSGGYHVLRFPFGGGESYDAHGMHQLEQPDGYIISPDAWRLDDRSGLIWPTVEGWAHLYALIYWEDGDYTELRDQYVRDPLGLSTGTDTTCTDHRPPSLGMQCFSKSHGVFVHPGTPVALRVSHNDGVPRKVTLAEFKMVIHT